MAAPVGEISLESDEISLNGMKISLYKHSQAGLPVCRNERSKHAERSSVSMSFRCGRHMER